MLCHRGWFVLVSTQSRIDCRRDREVPSSRSTLRRGWRERARAAAIEAAGTKVVLVEPGHRAALNARARGVSCVLNSSLQEAGFLPRSLAAVGLFDVLEHVADDEQFLALLHGLIAPGQALSHGACPSLTLVCRGCRGWLLSAIYLNALCKQLTAARFDVEYATYFLCCCRFPFFSFVQCQAA